MIGHTHDDLMYIVYKSEDNCFIYTKKFLLRTMLHSFHIIFLSYVFFLWPFLCNAFVTLFCYSHLFYNNLSMLIAQPFHFLPFFRKTLSLNFPSLSHHYIFTYFLFKIKYSIRIKLWSMVRFNVVLVHSKNAFRYTFRYTYHAVFIMVPTKLATTPFIKVPMMVSRIGFQNCLPQWFITFHIVFLPIYFLIFILFIIFVLFVFFSFFAV